MSEPKKRKTYTPEFKAKVGLEALRGVKTMIRLFSSNEPRGAGSVSEIRTTHFMLVAV
jgi:hypothetical protein